MNGKPDAGILFGGSSANGDRFHPGQVPIVLLLDGQRQVCYGDNTLHF